MIKTASFYISIICVCIFLGSLNKWIIILIAPIVLFMAKELSCSLLRGEGVYVCKGIISLLMLQNILIGMGAHLTANQDKSLRLLTQIPFATIATIWLITCVIHKNTAMEFDTGVCFSILMICIVLSAMRGTGTLQPALVTIRNMTVFFMAFGIGTKADLNDSEKLILTRHVVKWGIILCVIGFVLLEGGYPLNRALGIHEVYQAKVSAFNEGAFPGRFYTSLFTNKSYLRMGSIVFEPINLSYFLALALLCVLYQNRKKHVRSYVEVIILLLGLLMTFGKGGYIIVASSILCMCLFNIIPGGVKTKKRGAVLIVLLAGVVFVLYYVNNIGLAVLNHAYGISGTMKRVLKNPFGYGLGSGGNAAFAFGGVSSDEWLSSGGETALVSFLYQIGIVGVVAFVLCQLSMGEHRYYSTNRMGRLFLFIPFVMIGLSIMQDNTYAPQCIVPYMILQGGLRHDYTKLKYKVA